MAKSDRNAEIQTFLKRKGAIGIFARISHHGDRNKELQEKVAVSSLTLAKRLNEAMDLKLLMIEPQALDCGSKDVYRLTDAGVKIKHRIDDIGLDDTYTELQTLKTQFGNQCDSLVDWAGEEPFSSERRPWRPPE